MIHILSGGAIVDLETIPQLPRNYDAVLAADTLEHLSDPGRMLHLIHDALPVGAPLVLSVPNIANLYVRLNLLFGRLPYADRGLLDRTHRIFFTRSLLRRLLAEAGFQIEREAVSTIPLLLALPRLPRPALAVAALALEGPPRALPTPPGSPPRRRLPPPANPPGRGGRRSPFDRRRFPIGCRRRGLEAVGRHPGLQRALPGRRAGEPGAGGVGAGDPRARGIDRRRRLEGRQPRDPARSGEPPSRPHPAVRAGHEPGQGRRHPARHRRRDRRPRAVPGRRPRVRPARLRPPGAALPGRWGRRGLRLALPGPGAPPES